MPAIANGPVFLKAAMCNTARNNMAEFKVCKPVHHRTIQINHQLDATIF
jgi:hypothetical protein